jgi:hypothetical protein
METRPAMKKEQAWHGLYPVAAAIAATAYDDDNDE